MNNLKLLRKRKGVSQQEVADAVNVSRPAYTLYETGKRNLSADILTRLAAYFDVTTDVILGINAADPGWKDAGSIDRKTVDLPQPEPDLDDEGSLIPILGSVRAGYDYVPEEELIGYMEVEPALKKRFPDAYVLHVKGDSMEPEIRHGDIAICVPTPEVPSGTVAVVCINGDEGTVKRVRYDKDGLTLVPTNRKYQAVHYSPEDVQNCPVTIRARVVEIRHRYF